MEQSRKDESYHSNISTKPVDNKSNIACYNSRGCKMASIQLALDNIKQDAGD